MKISLTCGHAQKIRGALQMAKNNANENLLSIRV